MKDQILGDTALGELPAGVVRFSLRTMADAKSRDRARV